jgi:hypothetical protein
VKPTGGRTRHNDMLRLLLAVGLAASMLVIAPAQAFACSCVVSSLGEQAQRADTVVEGYIGDSTETGTTVSYDVTVDGSYKGELSPHLTVTTGKQSASCGLGGLATDEKYLLLLNRSGGGYDADACGGTARWTAKDAAEIADVLGPARVLKAAPPPQVSPARDSVVPRTAAATGSQKLRNGIVGGGVLALLVGATAFGLSRRSRLR